LVPLSAAGAGPNGAPGLSPAMSVRTEAPDAAGNLERARTNLTAAMAKLDAFLRRGGDEYAAQWKTYLYWESISAAAAQPASGAATLQAVACAHRCNVRGLELPEFVELRVRLREFIAAAAAAADPNLSENYAARLTELHRRLPALVDNPHEEDAVTV